MAPRTRSQKRQSCPATPTGDLDDSRPAKRAQRLTPTGILARPLLTLLRASSKEQGPGVVVGTSTPDEECLKALRARLAAIKQGDDYSCVFGVDIPGQVAKRFIEENQKPGLMMHFQNDRATVLYWWDWTLEHNVLRGVVTGEVHMELRENLGKELASDILNLGMTTHYITMPDGSTVTREGDAQLIHGEVMHQLRPGGIALEVAVHNETVDLLLDQAWLWMHTGQRKLTWAIKVFMPPSDNASKPVAPEAYFFALERLSSDQLYMHPVVSFGANSGCTAKGLPEYCLRYDAAFLYNGTDEEADVPLGTWMTLDLYNIRKALFRLLRNSEPNKEWETATSEHNAVQKDVAQFVAELNIATCLPPSYHAVMRMGTS